MNAFQSIHQIFFVIRSGVKFAASVSFAIFAKLYESERNGGNKYRYTKNYMHAMRGYLSKILWRTLPRNPRIAPAWEESMIQKGHWPSCDNYMTYFSPELSLGSSSNENATSLLQNNCWQSRFIAHLARLERD